jgi:hypothetical protein
MNALDWAEEGEHVEIAELLSHAMNPTPAAVLPQETHAVAPGPEAEQEGPHEESAFAEANPINEVSSPRRSCRWPSNQKADFVRFIIIDLTRRTTCLR